MHKCYPLLAAQAPRILMVPYLLSPWLWLPGLLRDLPLIGWLFNTGGPMSRSRTERIHSTLLSQTRSALQWPRQSIVVLEFPAHISPIDYAEGLLKQAGFATPDQALQQRTDLPTGMYYCHTQKLTDRHRRLELPQTDDERLRAALILGLCGPNFYSSDRAVIWTESRLTRAVGLYQLGGFYED